MKKIVMIFLLISALSGVLPLSAFGAENPSAWGIGVLREAEVEAWEDAPALASVSALTAETIEEIYQTLEEGCLAREEKVSLLSYNLTEDQLKDLYYDFVMMHPECLVNSFYRYGKIGNRVTYVRPMYLFETKEEHQAAQSLLRDSVAAYVEKLSGYDALEQLLFLHDELVYGTAYDEATADLAGKISVAEMAQENLLSFHAYNLFDKGTAVCQGYAQAFYMIGTALGYDVAYCYNDTHIWNYLRWNDVWYHVDATWDDPLADVPETSIHHYFLVTDERMKDHGEVWETNLTALPDCHDNQYEEGYLFNFPSRIAIVKEEGEYRFSYGDYLFYNTSLRTGEVIPVRSVGSGRDFYFCKENLKEELMVYTVFRDGKNLPVGIALSDRKDHQKVGQMGDYFLYRLPELQKPTGHQTTTIYFWGKDTMLPLRNV